MPQIQQVITRFAPSPTGYLHIGGARTALFNYLFAKHHNGKFLLRIEDTDEARSNSEALAAIFESLRWLGIDWDDEIVFQSKRYKRHQEIAQLLVKTGKAYHCYCSKEDIDRQRQEATDRQENFIFCSPWRNNTKLPIPENIKPVIRLKTPNTGTTIIYDQLQGEVIVNNELIEDTILIRSDGKPTYMLAVVVDDHDMGITDIIRGDDHLNNAVRQQLIYQALSWNVPNMVHIPLIYGEDGTKLSKRHGALGVEHYRKMGYLPEALCNYLLRLGWAHGDDEIISRKQAIKWFDVKGLSKGPARLDFNKMQYVNSIYLRSTPNELLINLIENSLSSNGIQIDHKLKNNILLALDSIKPRIKLLTDIQDIISIYSDDIDLEKDLDAKQIIQECNKNLLKEIITLLEQLKNFDKDSVQNSLKNFAKIKECKLGELMKPIRCLITGKTNSPSVFEIMAIIGKEITLKRLQNY